MSHGGRTCLISGKEIKITSSQGMIKARSSCLISINLFPLETWRKDSPLRRFSNLPQTKNKRLVSLISCFGWSRNACGCKGGCSLSRNFYVRTGVKFTCVKQKGYDQFMRISDIAEHSRYENFALTRMFYKHCFCDSNIPSSRGWLKRNHFPRSIISNRMQRLNTSIRVWKRGSWSRIPAPFSRESRIPHVFH